MLFDDFGAIFEIFGPMRSVALLAAMAQMEQSGAAIAEMERAKCKFRLR